jgi:hypothetical protein
MATRETPGTHTHSHLWLVGLIGVAAGLLLLIYVPSLPAVSGTILLFGGFHLVGALVLLASLYVMAGKRLASRLTGRTRRQDAKDFDFGWAPAWALGPWIAALILVALAVAVQVTTPAYWPLAMVLTLLAANFGRCSRSSVCSRCFSRAKAPGGGWQRVPASSSATKACSTATGLSCSRSR